MCVEATKRHILFRVICSHHTNLIHVASWPPLSTKYKIKSQARYSYRMPCNRTHLCVCFVTRHLFFFPHRVPTAWHCHHKKKSRYLSTGEMRNIPSKACGGCMPTGCRPKKQYASLSAAVDNVAHGRGRRCTRPRTTLHTAEDNKRDVM